MTNDDAPIPIPVGPYFVNWGPADGLILKEHRCPVMGILASPDGRQGPIDIAWLAGSIPSWKGTAQVFRLEVHKVEIPGYFVCRCREFVRIGDEAEEV